jgi:hypothetical protein
VGNEIKRAEVKRKRRRAECYQWGESRKRYEKDCVQIATYFGGTKGLNMGVGM